MVAFKNVDYDYAFRLVKNQNFESRGLLFWEGGRGSQKTSTSCVRF